MGLNGNKTSTVFFVFVICNCIYFWFRKIQTSAILEKHFQLRSRDHFAVIGMLLCIRLPNFVLIWAATAEMWRHIYFLRWRPRPLKTISSFGFVDVSAFRRSRSTITPNFVDIINSLLRYYYFRFRKNVRHIGILLPVSIPIISP